MRIYRVGLELRRSWSDARVSTLTSYNHRTVATVRMSVGPQMFVGMLLLYEVALRTILGGGAAVTLIMNIDHYWAGLTVPYT